MPSERVSRISRAISQDLHGIEDWVFSPRKRMMRVLGISGDTLNNLERLNIGNILYGAPAITTAILGVFVNNPELVNINTIMWCLWIGETFFQIGGVVLREGIMPRLRKSRNIQATPLDPQPHKLIVDNDHPRSAMFTYEAQ